MPKHLLIVESPAKAKTIEKFLGGDFTVKSSYGHIRDLEKGNSAVDVSLDFKPHYIISPEKLKLVKDLKDAVKKVDEVWLATDEDREGEAISWHLCEVLNLDVHKTKRIVFREITKQAITKAIQSPRNLDLNLVNAQQARRILDRLVGFELSEILWRKVKGKLSAGRVQSVAVKLIVEKEREINQFNTELFFKVEAFFSVYNEQGKSILLKSELTNKLQGISQANDFLKSCIGAEYTIQSIEVKPLSRKPAAPFTTSTLQQEASRKLGFSVTRTMIIAQKLYEAGHISYMRTDSTSLSEQAILAIENEIVQSFGAKYSTPRRYKSKSANAQEAHEAIRPTYFEKSQITGDRDEARLYELIWKRAMASQMAEALLEKTQVKIGISTVPKAVLLAEGEVLKFDGFLKLYLESNDDDEEDEVKGMLPPLKVKQVLPLSEMKATERQTRGPSRYSEAGLVKKLEELGIGRPSTYAPTISKIMEEGRGYVVKESKDGVEQIFQVLKLENDKISQHSLKENTGSFKNRLVPTDMGITVADFLDENFVEIMNYSFTAEIEERFDAVALGKIAWTKMLKDFYFPFHELVVQTMESATRPTRERILGKDPVSGLTILTRMTRVGPVVQMGTPDELGPEGKPKYGNLVAGQSIETLTFEEALLLFSLPRDLGTYLNEKVSIGKGKFGPYVKFGEKFISIPRTADPFTITIEEAQNLINQKEKEDAPVHHYQNEPVTKGKGRFGPFLKWKEYFINIPKKYNPDTISVKDMDELISAKINKENSRFILQWESEHISVERGRWGPFIRFKKEMISFPKTDGIKIDDEQAALFDLDSIKKIIEKQIPDAFKTKIAAKKTKAKKI
ncbi:MAG: type I DNA topoisomerase [Saprospiraceae bacterium]|jgi:DNA topoisomerase-1